MNKFKYLAFLTGLFLLPHAALGVLAVDTQCLRLSDRTVEDVPPHTSDQLKKLEIWIALSATLAFAKTNLGMDYDAEQVMNQCPNLAFFNFARATGCVIGVENVFASHSQLWVQKQASLDAATLRTQLNEAISVFSRDLNYDYKSVFRLNPTPITPANNHSPEGAGIQ